MGKTPLAQKHLYQERRVSMSEDYVREFNSTTTRHIPGGYNLFQKSQIAPLETVKWTGKFLWKNMYEYLMWVSVDLNNNHHDGRNIYHLCACVRCLALSSVGFDYWQAMLVEDDNTEYVDPRPPFDIELAADKEFVILPYTKDQWTSLDTCLYIPLFPGEEVYKINIFYGKKPTSFFMRKDCWHRAIYPMILWNEIYNKATNHPEGVKTKVRLHLTDEDKYERNKILMRMTSIKNSHTKAVENEDIPKIKYYLMRLVEEGVRLDALGGIPSQWAWIMED